MASSLTWPVPGRWPSVAARERSSMDVPDGALATLDERALVEACLSNQAGAFDLIVERHRRAVFMLCFPFVGHHEEAGGLLQGGFLRAPRRARGLPRPSSAPPSLPSL